jgi:T5SS/PEP-CTERM-associated repeat protein
MSSRRASRLFALCAAAALNFFPSSAVAVVRRWSNPAGGSFDLTSNWSAGVVPDPADTALFDIIGATYTLTFPSITTTNDRVIIGRDNVTFDILTHEYRLTTIDHLPATPSVTVGEVAGDNAALHLINGTLNSVDGVIAKDAGSFGSATLSIGAQWNLSNALTIAYAGQGQLRIDNSADVASRGVNIGSAPGSIGAVTVTDPGSSWSNLGPFIVGPFGQGALNVQNGAHVSSSGAVSVRGASSSANITGANSMLTADTLDVGPTGSGVVDVRNSGFLNVTGPASLYPLGTLRMYDASVATSQLRFRGGTFSAYGNFTPNISNAGGTVDVPASQILSLSGDMVSDAGALLAKTGAGAAIITGSQTHAPGAIFHARGGQLVLNTNAGTPATAAAAAVSNLSIIVGPEPAAVILNADQNLHALTLNESLPGRQSFNLSTPDTPSAFRSVRIDPAQTTRASLWAAIASANRAGAPDPQDGIFDSGLPSHPNSRLGLARLADAHGDSSFLIRPTRIGDLNLDGAVTISDFIDLSSNFNASGPNITWQEGDLNYDNQITISDFIDLAANFGASYAGAILPIPEPSTHPQLLLLTTLAASRRVRLSRR